MKTSPSKPPSLILDPIQTLSGTVTLPGSKSLSNRILVISMLAEGETRIHNLLDSEDVRYMVEALTALQIPFEENREALEITVQGCGGNIPAEGAELFLGNAGTAMRPLTAALAIGKGRFLLDGVPRMRERPIRDLVDALTQLGVNLRCTEETGCPPVEIHASGIPGGTCHLSGAISSQYLTAVLMAAPYAHNDVRIVIKDKLVSRPYVQMTLNLMDRFGIKVVNDNFQEFHIRGQQCYRTPGKIYVEGDASSASYFLGGAAVTGGKIKVIGCGSDSIQGDAHFAEVLEKMGADVKWEPQAITVQGKPLHGIDVDMNAMPDVGMTLAVIALFAEGPTAIRNIYNWRVKETERIKAVSTELRKLGARVDEGEDYIVVTPPATIHPAAIDTYDDHRMAMAFSLAACGNVPVTINDPHCVVKTFPDYFEVLSTLIAP
ncbi:MAG: 3-phosphoshikimate 1-carboxyvinyltransferase [SAR324 cluster bacterium]|nr:3-phosphoshikimate 1-carboxyvinyltransferase [SAR324 cluster bacterium]